MKFPLCAFVLLLFTAAASAGLPFKETSHERFETRARTVLAPLAGKSVRDLKVLYLSADLGPWLDTGLMLQQGDRVTMVVEGTVWWSRTYKLGLDQPLTTWARVGVKGPVFHGTDRSNTFVAEHGGALQLKSMPTRWLDRSGRYTPEPPPANPDTGGGASVLLIRWAAGADPAAELSAMSNTADAPAWAAAEIERLKKPPQVPAGWNYLWELGPANIFHEIEVQAADGGPARRMDVHTKADVAILQRDIEHALSSATKLAWNWKIDALPAAVSENTAPTHDYLSIAVEFDNGRDLTYFWSRDLPVGTHFHCPLEAWKDRETHVAIRSGTADLGRWLKEEHPILEDYARAIGGTPPGRIVRVWLIANSVFQRGEGRGQFGDIRLIESKGEAKVW